MATKVALLGQVFGRHYEVRQPLGDGGMGSVYRAVDLRMPGVQWAVKVASPDSDDADAAELLQLARLEAELLAELSGTAHPNIPWYQDSFTLRDGTHALVMELISGSTWFADVHRAPGGLTAGTVLPGAI